MNYAQDRLDRKSRNGTLQADYETAYSQRNHRLVAQTLRDAGCNSAACVHYLRAVACENDNNNENDGAVDNAIQMIELAGFPHEALIVAMQYRQCGRRRFIQQEEYECPTTLPSFSTLFGDHQTHESSSDLMQDDEKRTNEQPCGKDETRQLLFSEREEDEDTCAEETKMQQLLQQADDQALKTCASANDIWQACTMKTPLPCITDAPLSSFLQVWNTYDEHPAFSYPLQLLFVKLLFQCYPRLVVRIAIELPIAHMATTMDRAQRNLLKSHWAYYTFIRSLSLGKVKIKLAGRKKTQTASQLFPISWT